MSAADHERAAVGRVARCGVLTLSDTRTPQTDVGGKTVMAYLRAEGHAVVDYRVLTDDAEPLRAALDAIDVDVIITTGGTGISSRDLAIDVVTGWVEKPLPGFGEMFRMLSYEQIGPAAMLSRAAAGIKGRVVVFSLPGSVAAVELAMTKLVVPQLPHLIRELRR